MASRIVFMGTPPFAVSALRACLDLGEVPAVITQPDKPRHRGQSVSPSAVKEFALGAGIPVLQPPKLRDPAFLEHLKLLRPDVCVVTAYGKILPEDLLALPAHGCVNLHASLLPRFRGAAPIQWAIASGDEKTGVCLMKMDAGLDTGPVLACEETPIRPDETFDSLQSTLAELGGQVLRKYLPPYLRGVLAAVPQRSEDAVHAPILKREDGRLDFSRSASELERRIRAFDPWPGSFTAIGGRALKVHRARVESATGAPGEVLSIAPVFEVACGRGSLVLLEVQPEGKRSMSAQEFLAGHPIAVGARPFAG